MVAGQNQAARPALVYPSIARYLARENDLVRTIERQAGIVAVQQNIACQTARCAARADRQNGIRNCRTAPDRRAACMHGVARQESLRTLLKQRARARDGSGEYGPQRQRPTIHDIAGVFARQDQPARLDRGASGVRLLTRQRKRARTPFDQLPLATDRRIYGQEIRTIALDGQRGAIAYAYAVASCPRCRQRDQAQCELAFADREPAGIARQAAVQQQLADTEFVQVSGACTLPCISRSLAVLTASVPPDWISKTWIPPG